MPKLFKTFEEILSRAHGNFEESSIIITNYCIIIINAYYNYIYSAQHIYYTSNKDLLEEYGKEENLEVTAPDNISCLKRRLKTFCPMSRIRPVTTKPAPQ